MTDTRHLQAGFAEVNGTRLYYEMAGSGPPLVLIHGGLVDRRMWDDQFNVFAQHHRVIRYDMRGQGNSIMPNGAFAHHHDLHALLGVLGIDRAVLLGLSGGGLVAIDYAITFPTAVAGLILVAPGLSGYTWSADMQAQGASIEAAFQQGDLNSAIDQWLHMLTIGPRRTADQIDPLVLERVRDMVLHTVQQPQGAGTNAPLDPPAVGRLAEIHAPTLLLIGDQDAPDLHAIVDLIAAQVADAQRVVMPDVAHMPNMERPDHFNRLVLDFLSTLAQGATF